MASSDREETIFGRKVPLLPITWGTLLLISSVGLATILFALFISYTLLTGSNYILHGVSVGGVPVGNQTRSEAWNTLRTHSHIRSIELVSNNQVWATPLMTELGVNLDIHRMVNQAYEQGRQSHPLVGMFRVLSIDVNLRPSYTTEWSVAENYLNGIAEAFVIPPQDAQLTFVNGQFAAGDPVPGQRLDVAGTLGQWRSIAEIHDSIGAAAVQLPLTTTPIQAEVTDISSYVQQANEVLARPIYLEAYDPTTDAVTRIDVSAETWASFLNFDLVDNQLTLTGNQENIASYLNEFSNTQPNGYVDASNAPTIANAIETGKSGLTLRMLHPQLIHTVQSGESIASIGNQYGIPYPWIQALNPNADTLAIGQQLTIPSVDDMLPLPVVRGKRVIVSISQQYMWAYENGAVKWEWPVSTGIEDSPTSPGIFQVQSHEIEAYGGAWDLYMPNFMGVYLPAPGLELMNGFHGYPTRDGTNLLWTNSLGSPATYGCILIDNANIAQFYDWAEKGVVVEIQQ